MPQRDNTRGRIALCLLAVLVPLLVAAGVLAYLRSDSLAESIERTRREQLGSEYLAGVKAFAAAAIEHRGKVANASNSIPTGGPKSEEVGTALTRLEALDARLGSGNTQPSLAGIRGEWTAMEKELGVRVRKPNLAVVRDHSAAMLRHARVLAVVVADASGLAHDPDPGTSQLELVLRSLIADADDLSQAALLAQAAMKAKYILRPDEGRLHRLIGRLGQNDDEFRREWAELERTAQLPPMDGQRRQRAELIRRIENDILLDPPVLEGSTAPGLRDAGIKSVAADFELFDATAPELTRRLATSIDKQQEMRKVVWGVAAVGFALSLIIALIALRLLYHTAASSAGALPTTIAQRHDAPAPDAVAGVCSSADAVHRAADALASGAAQQADRAAAAAAALGVLAASMRQTAGDADAGEGAARNTLDAAHRGTEAIEDAAGGIRRVSEQVQDASRHLEHLIASSHELEQSAAGVEDLAERLSLAALNASLQTGAEAAGGDFVREVGQLAERCAESTRKIAAFARAIPGEAGAAAAAVDGSAREAAERERQVDQAARSLAEVEEAAGRLAALAGRVAEAARQQAGGGNDLALSVGELAHSARRNADGTRDAAQSASLLASLALELNEA